MSKVLVAYFSASGVTAKVAHKLAEVANADLFEIKPAKPYTSADLDWNDKTSRSTIEMNDKKSRPDIVDKAPDVSGYDKIFLGFPIWWYTAPRVIATFLDSGDFTGKQIILFATSGGSSLGHTAMDLKNICPSANFVTGKVFSSWDGIDVLKNWAASF